MRTAFHIQRGKGFSIKFENGWEVSVQFGTMNYCANRYEVPLGVELTDAEIQIEAGLKGCATAEIAIYRPDGSMYPAGGNDYQKPIGWCSPETVAEWIQFARWQAPPPDHDEEDEI